VVVAKNPVMESLFYFLFDIEIIIIPSTVIPIVSAIVLLSASARKV